MQRGISKCVALALSFVGCYAGCDVMSHVPSAEKLSMRANPSSAFIVQERDIHGIYGNMDIDSAIFGYYTLVASEEGFWETIDHAAAEDGWTPAGTLAGCRRYLRIRPKTRQGGFHSVEEVRIAFEAESQRVVVAWVQADEVTLPTDFPRSGPEGEFAEREVWPRFGQAICGREGIE